MKMVKKKTPLAKAAKGKIVKPKAMYGKTVKPMMKKAGTVPKAQAGKTAKPKEENQFYPSKMDRGYYNFQDAVSNFMMPEYIFGKPSGMRNMGTMDRTVDSLNVQDKAYGRTTLPREQYLNAEKIVNKKRKGGTLSKAQKGIAVKDSGYNMGKTAKPKAIKDSGYNMGKMANPKAMYGKSVKPGMMRKGGTTKRKTTKK